jgi:hypothetical protein
LCNLCCSGKAIRITYSEFVSIALGIQYAMSMRRVTLSSVTCPALHRISHVISHGTIFGKEVIEHKMCVLIFSTTLSPTFFILRSQRHVILNVDRSSCKLTVILSDINFLYIYIVNSVVLLKLLKGVNCQTQHINC